MTHTPGPWQVCRNWVCEENDPGHNVGICTIEDRPEMKANAQLIAAAPDMYKALMALMYFVADIDNGFTNKETAKAARCKAANDALKKAGYG